MLFCLGLSGRITQISNILCASASLREKSTDEFRLTIPGTCQATEHYPNNPTYPKSLVARVLMPCQSFQ